MAASWQDLFNFLEKLGGTLDQLTEIQREKTAAVRRDDLMIVNECMKKEQAISLSLRAMDQKREKLLAALGIGPVPLSALPDNCPEEYRLKAREIAERLRDRYLVYKSAAEVSRTTLEVNLHQIEKIIEDTPDPHPGGSGMMTDFRA